MEKGDSDYKVSYLGPEATYTHIACQKYFKDSGQKIPKDSIQEVFEAVEQGETDYGVIPVENSIEGSVNRTLDLFIESGVKVCGEITIPISHNLLSKNGRPESIRKIYSHPQAIEQCRNWLRRNFPRIELLETSSTAKAAKKAQEDPEAGAIGNSLTAHFYGLKIIHSKIEDYPFNFTRFWVIGNKIGERTGNDKTSILFSIPHVPGSLYRVLGIFSNQMINLTKIESRPMKYRPWEYIFFIDFEGHIMDSPVKEGLTRLEDEVSFFKVLGSYPRSSQSQLDQWWWSNHLGDGLPIRGP
ncbi:MAG: prephenate dehydratase [Thermodesulfobacteriota bacterium]